jgi:hypothetical protein
MRTQVRKISRLLTIFCILLTSISGCSDDEDEKPVEPGRISGFVFPANAVNKITLEFATGGIKEETLPLSNGAFNFTSVPPGDYKIAITTHSSLYDTPEKTSVSVSSGKESFITEIFVPYNADEQSGTATYTLDGTSYENNSSDLFLFYNFISSQFLMQGAPPNTPGYYWFLTLKVLNGPGTYSTSNELTAIEVLYYSAEFHSEGHWTTENGGTGSVTITTLNTATRTASGTFSATLVPQSDATGTKEISGTFTNVRY